MKKVIKHIVIAISLLVCFNSSAFGVDARKNDTFEFVNQEIRDVVYILSLRSGRPIICDDTVSGLGSFMYANNGEEDFEDAFDAFLYTNKLLVIKNDELWTVTKVKIDECESGNISVKSYDSTLSTVFEKISEKTGRSIIFETLPMQRASFNIQNQSVYDIVRLILQPFSEYTVIETASGVQISKKKNSGSVQETGLLEESICNINYSNNKYDVIIKNTKISEILNKIFLHSNESYSDFLQTDERVKSVSFTEKTLRETLQLVLEQVNAEPVYTEGIWYIFPKSERVNRNTVTGRLRKWHTVNLKNTSFAKLIPLVTARYQGILITELSPSQAAFYATGQEHEEIRDFLERVDDEIESVPIHLKYIKTSELLAALPPSVSKDEITDTGTGNSFFYTGSESKREVFLNQLKEIDIQKKLVRYDLLILQYEKSSNLTWGISTSVRPTEIGDRMLITGEVGNLLNINFDAITAFGLTFSEKINSAISNNQATVFADTTLYGLSGEKLTFKNTNTYRYKDASVEPATGKEVFSTVTREITSGLVLEIDGWVSGDGIITMQINTSVSKQGVDVSKKNGNPPPTSEKNITTKIRAKNGEPVVLSGLSQTDFTEASQGIPFISKIPLLGNLFKSKDVSKTKTEMTIYLLPHIEERNEEKNGTWKIVLDSYLASLEEREL